MFDPHFSLLYLKDYETSNVFCFSEFVKVFFVTHQKILFMTNFVYVFRQKLNIFSAFAHRVAFLELYVLSFERHEYCYFRLKSNGKIRVHQFYIEILEGQFNMADGRSVVLSVKRPTRV